MKIATAWIALLLMTCSGSSMAQGIPDASVYMDQEFFVGITVATFKHNQSYCADDYGAAVQDTTSLIGLIEKKLATVTIDSARKTLHFDLVHWYGRLSRIHRRANQSIARDDALRRASEYAERLFPPSGSTGANFINRLVDEFDAK